ncbi:MAG: hypothetical protein LBG04_04185, partial [Holosporaceae bacterium]|nr:hypothetical protein [Holosporaceae bacterium]
MGYMFSSNKKRVLPLSSTYDNCYAKNCLEFNCLVEIKNNENNFISDKLLPKIEEKRIADEEMTMQYKVLVVENEGLVEKIETVDDVNKIYAI